MTDRGQLSLRACALAVLIAFGAGLLGSLALRPPGAPPLAAATRAGEDPLGARIRWRVPVAFGTNLPALGDNMLYVRDAAADSSKGAIRLELYEPGEIVSAFAITDAVRDGKVQAGYTWLGYDQGRIPASVLFGAVPFGMEPWEYTAWWYEGDGRRLAEALYEARGVHPILCGLIGPETAGWFRRPVDSLADVEGLKIRFAGIGGKVLQRLGASVTMIPGSDLFQALEKGAIDATEYSLPVVDQKLGFDRVARINYFPGWHQTFTAGHLVVNLARWQALDDADRALLETACTAGVTRNLARGEALEGPVIEQFAAAGVSARRLPLPLLRELQRVTGEVLAEEAAGDADFAEILASQQAFSESYGIWKRLAYLPRDF
ncbi:MAG: TRAP transporter substrate-binding protein [Pseudomonadales bacterium]|jgi:TRAP-type mannitol/chloroaromatic compound transport system substrate-binding protein|nr:TRAP transporter substrate-binding protein [Pseudomonadales bacterium]